MGYRRRLLHALLGVTLMAAVLAATSGAQADNGPLTGDKPCAETTPPAGATKFLLAGDSIVHESRGDWTWRYFLYKQLVAAGVATDFVGDYNWLIDPNKSDWPYCDYQDPSFDTDFTAYPGRKLSDYNLANVKTNNVPWIQNEVATWHPDVLVMLAGANDLANGATADDTLTAAQQLVANARAANPDIKIVLVATPVGGNYDNHPDAAYNTMLEQAAPIWSDSAAFPDSPVVVTAPMQDWGTADHTWDGIHPNVIGEQLIAGGVADALHSMGIGNAGLPVDPAYKVGLRQPVTNFVATLDDSSVDMSWTLPIGANAVDIMARDTTGGVIGPWVEKESLTWYPGDILGVGQCHASAPCTSYSLAGLALGHTYDIDVHSEKGLSIATDVWSTAPGGGPGITSITMPAPPPPPPPTKPVAVSRFTATARTHAIVIAWGALSNATEYVYSWRAHGTAAFASKAVPGGVTSVVVPNLVAGKKYDFEVRGTNSAGPGVLSSMIQQVAGANKLGTPKAPKLASVAGHKLKTTWTATAGATSYLVQYRLVGGAWKTLKVTAGKSATSPKLVAKKSYDVRIRPYDGLVGGAYSAPTRVKVK